MTYLDEIGLAMSRLDDFHDEGAICDADYTEACGRLLRSEMHYLGRFGG